MNRVDRILRALKLPAPPAEKGVAAARAALGEYAAALGEIRDKARGADQDARNRLSVERDLLTHLADRAMFQHATTAQRTMIWKQVAKDFRALHVEVREALEGR